MVKLISLFFAVSCFHHADSIVAPQTFAEPELIGFLNIYKEKGMTSHDVINRLRRILSIKQIGHSGTLDPMAEGVMVVGVGKACRLLQYVPDEKTYLAEILIGQTTDTDDIEGRILSRSGDLSHIDEQTVADRLIKFLGKQSQIPPIYSA